VADRVVTCAKLKKQEQTLVQTNPSIGSRRGVFWGTRTLRFSSNRNAQSKLAQRPGGCPVSTSRRLPSKKTERPGDKAKPPVIARRRFCC